MELLFGRNIIYNILGIGTKSGGVKPAKGIPHW